MTLAQERLKKGQEYLRQALGKPDAGFRNGQWQSIARLLNKKRVLVVQRTGWGKSMVYFLATKLLREQGAGPTLLISPLLSLMRNQIEAANRIQITARTINSSNKDEWYQIQDELIWKKVDILIISPERLANGDFINDVLSNIVNNIGLFVVDEAHCISDWGHEFRPYYKLIRHVLRALPPNVPVLATTATANNRVVEDIKSQLGESIVLQRGPLIRKSLKLQNINMPSPAARMAWLAKTIPTLPGSGIIYTLTRYDADRLTEWLQINNVSANAYHAGSSNRERERLEQQLLNNEIKVLVATVALGMGFDKPDLGFVIHFQRPSSVVHYYHQVGRAGRALDEAYGILLCGEEDDRIADYFINNAFPPQKYISDIFKALGKSSRGLSVQEIQRILNLPKDRIDKTLEFLAVESPAPVKKIRYKWRLTPAATSYRIDKEHIEKITGIRRKEQRNMRSYMSYPGCLMIYLQAALNGSKPRNCGQCINCNPEMLLDTTYDDDLANQAGSFLRRNYQRILPKKRWPGPKSGRWAGKYRISSEQWAEEGRALCLWRDTGWGQLVAQGKDTNKFSDELVDACEEMVQNWSPAISWVTCIPSLKHPELVSDFAERLAKALGLPFSPCIEKVKDNRQQKEMENKYQQVKNLNSVFKITDECPGGGCLLIDDVMGSGWTFTVAAGLLRQKGCAAVYPLALALNSLWIN